MGADASLADREIHLVGIGKDAQPLFLVGGLLRGADRVLGQVITTQGDVLARRGDRAPVAGPEDVIGGEHEQPGLQLRLDAQGNVHGHLIAVEVRIISSADQGVNPDGIPFNQFGLESLHRQAMQGRGAVEKHGVLPRHLVEGVPDDGFLFLDHLFRATHGVHLAELLQTANDEGLEEDQGHLFRQTAFVQLEFGTNHDDGAPGVIDPLPQEIHPEPPCFSLKHVGERLQRAVACPGDGTAMPPVIHQCVDRLLQHPLFVADDHLRGF